MRLLWLTYERPPHPDAVVHPVDSRDAAFVIALLEHPYERRIELTRQLAVYLATQDSVPQVDRQPVPCRTPSGLYHLVPWRLAKWLRHTLPASECVIDRTLVQIQQWQSADSARVAVSAE